MDYNQALEHKDLLRTWLKGKGFHPADIRYALTWYMEQIVRDINPSDEEVFRKADESHKSVVEVISPPKIDMAYKPECIVWATLGGFIGGFIGASMYQTDRIISWLVSTTTQLVW